MLERHLAVKWSKYFPPGADVEEVHWMIMQHTFNGQSFDTNNAACVELERALDTNSISQDQQEFAAFWGNQGSQPQQADTISISEYQQLIAALSDQSEQVDANSASHCEKQDGGAIASQEEHLEEAYSHVECSRCKCHLANPFFHFTSACRTKRARSYRCVFCNTNKSSSIPFPLDGLDPVRFPSGTWGYIAKDLWDREDIRMAYARELEKVGYWWNNVQRSDDKQDCDTLLRLGKCNVDLEDYES